ncbi:MAG: TIGR02449 family protein [Methyloglobulus sp.]|nr:TIGR02449 family protein [Methyloglobulus sp.]
MTEKQPYPSLDSQSLDIRELEKKLDQLIEQYNSVKHENESLKSKQHDWLKEKAALVEKTTLARNRVEAMISRLKTMGQG